MYETMQLPLAYGAGEALGAEATATRSPLIFVIDDDPVFCRHLQRVAEKHHVRVVFFHPDHDFARLPFDGDFDVAVIDYDLGVLTGTQVSALYRETPVLLVSGSYRPESSRDSWPGSVRGFLPKVKGVATILRAALNIGHEAGRAIQ